MSNNTPRCPVCGSLLNDGTTTYTVDLGFGVVVVRDVPARVCEQCGDASLTTDVAVQLESIVDSAHANHQEVSITRWRDAVA